MAAILPNVVSLRRAQVIAVLDHDILRQLVGGAEYHKVVSRS